VELTAVTTGLPHKGPAIDGGPRSVTERCRLSATLLDEAWRKMSRIAEHGSHCIGIAAFGILGGLNPLPAERTTANTLFG